MEAHQLLEAWRSWIHWQTLLQSQAVRERAVALEVLHGSGAAQGFLQSPDNSSVELHLNDWLLAEGGRAAPAGLLDALWQGGVAPREAAGELWRRARRVACTCESRRRGVLARLAVLGDATRRARADVLALAASAPGGC